MTHLLSQQLLDVAFVHVPSEIADYCFSGNAVMKCRLSNVSFICVFFTICTMSRKIATFGLL